MTTRSRADGYAYRCRFHRCAENGIVATETDVRDGAAVRAAVDDGVARLGRLDIVAAKHGVAGLTKTLANELARHSIRVNAVHPTTVDTPMIHNEYTYGVFAPGRKVSEVTRQEAAAAMSTAHALPVGWVDASDISSAVLWLVSDAARYVTGVQLPIDAGATVK